MKHIPTLLTALVLAPLAAFHAAEAAESPTKPNIVFILADDLGYECGKIRWNSVRWNRDRTPKQTRHARDSRHCSLRLHGSDQRTS